MFWGYGDEGGEVVLWNLFMFVIFSHIQADRGFASLYSHSQVGVVDRDCT